ncbi:MAG TPA: hypothetical protein VN873_07790 [Candidatus Angelobacter sp.]|nr:hypothetical protein [Candidatus Angelobacter sp.]
MPNALILMASTTKREYLRQLVSDKNRWSRALTAEEKALGFLGWHERGYLPHCDFPGLVQFVTYRLDDSMPASRRGEWEHLLKIEDVRQRRAQLKKYLDRGIGKCFLRQAKIAEIVESSLLHFHGELYDLLAWCVMPNHVHVLVHIWETPLWKIIAAWKRPRLQERSNFCALSTDFRIGEIRKLPTRRSGERRSNGSANTGTHSCETKTNSAKPFTILKPIQ